MNSTSVLDVPSPKAVSVQTRNNGWLALFLVLLVFTIANFLTATRSPTVWRDEVLYADPGVNLAAGRGFTSTAWPFQPSHELFVSNVPGHSLLLAGWIKVLGLSVLSVRALDYLLAAAVVILLYAALLRLTNRGSPFYATLFAAALMGGYGISFSYRSARPDMLGILAGAAILFFAIGTMSRWRYLSLVLLGAAIPLCGLQLVPYFCVLGFLIFVTRPRQTVARLVAIGTGIGLGLAGWVAFLVQQGLWASFLGALKGQSAAVSGIAARFRPMIAGLTIDFSTHFVTAGLLILVVWQWRRGRLTRRSAALLGLLSAVLIPAAVGFAGNFPIYYSWMKFVPATFLLVVALIEESDARELPRRLRGLVIACLVLSAVFLPLRVAVTATQWEARSYDTVTQLIEKAIKRDDVAFCSIEAYYPVKVIARETYVEPYVNLLSESERNKLTIIIVRSEDEHRIVSQIGGEWVMVARYSAGSQVVETTSRLYDMVVLRRRTQGL